MGDSGKVFRLGVLFEPGFPLKKEKAESQTGTDDSEKGLDLI